MIRKYLGPSIERFLAARPVQPFLFAMGVAMVLGGAIYTASSIFF